MSLRRAFGTFRILRKQKYEEAHKETEEALEDNEFDSTVDEFY